MATGGLGGIKAGKAFVMIEAVDRTAFIFKRISTKMKKFANQMASLGRDMVRKGLVATLPASGSLKVFASFDDAMRKVEARSTGTTQQMEALRNQAKELGRTTSFTARQVGSLQAKLAQKGFDRSERGIKGMTGAVLDLAKAAGEGGEEDAVIAPPIVTGKQSGK